MEHAFLISKGFSHRVFLEYEFLMCFLNIHGRGVRAFGPVTANDSG